MKKKKEIIKDAALPAALDILGCFGVPTALGQHFYQESVQRRIEAAREILLSEIRKGNFENVDRDEAVSIIERYKRYAIEGAAKRNLRLMAKLIKEMSDRNVLTAPSFIKHSEILSSLTEEEIRCLVGLCKDGRKIYQQRVAEKFREPYSPEHTYQSLLRTGLIYSTQKANSSINHETSANENRSVVRHTRSVETEMVTIYRITPLMKELLEYTDSFLDEDSVE